MVKAYMRTFWMANADLRMVGFVKANVRKLGMAKLDMKMCRRVVIPHVLKLVMIKDHTYEKVWWWW